jgi:cytochrome c-type biogenesis protein CcmH/NrfG
VEERLGEARSAASTGTVLARVEAVNHLHAGRLTEAAEAAEVSLSWHRSREEQSDAWVTLARVYRAEGRAASMDEALSQASHLWPENPRLRTLADLPTS